MAKTTLKIDRLSNSEFTIGLKNGATFNNTDNNLTLNKTLNYTSIPSSDKLSDTSLIYKSYVDSINTNLTSAIKTNVDSKIFAGTRIVKATDNATSNVTLSLGEAYLNTDADSFGNKLKALDTTDTKLPKISVGTKYAWFTGQKQDERYGEFAPSDGNSGNVIVGIRVDEYGAVTGVTYKQIAASDLDISGGDNTYDRYTSWKLNVGSTSADVEGTGNSTSEKPLNSAVKFDGTAIDVSYELDSANYAHKLTFKPVVDDEYIKLVTTTSDTKISHATKTNAAQTEAAIYKLSIDAAGHIDSSAAISYEDFSGINQFQAYSGASNKLGLVNYSEITTAAATQDTGFYAQNGNWYKIPYDSIKVTSDTTDGAIPIVAVPGATPNITQLKYNAGVTLNPNSGNITATSFTGSGSGLTDLDASQINKGSLDGKFITKNTVDPEKLKGIDTGSGIIMSDGTSFSTITTTNPEANKNYVLTQTKVTNTGTGSAVSTSFKDISTLIGDYISGTDAMIYKGTIGTTDSGATYEIAAASGSTVDVTSLKTLLGDFLVGYTYKAVSAFTIEDTNSIKHKVEVGDLITVIARYDEASPKAYFSVAQANLDGAVTFNSGAGTGVAENGLVFFANTSGTTIQGAGSSSDFVLKSDGDNSYISGTFEYAKKLKNSISLWGNTFDGSSSLDAANTLTSGHIVPATSETYNIGTAENKYNIIYATTFNGNLSGNASSATTAETANKVQHALSIGTGDSGKTYDGSKAISIELTDLGGISNIGATGTGNGDIISTLSVAKADGENPVISYTKKYFGDVVSITNTAEALFTPSVTTGSNKLTFDYAATAYTANKLYYTELKQLGYGGTFVADKLLVGNPNTNKEVLTKQYIAGTTTKPTTTEILVTEYDAEKTNNSYGYGFVKSGITINSTGTLNNTADTSIATEKVVSKAISDAVSTVENGSVKTLSYAISSSIDKTVQLSANTTLRRIVLEVTNAASVEGTLSVSMGNSGNLMQDTYLLTEAGVYIVDTYRTSATSTNLTIKIADATSLSGFIHIDYSTAMQAA